MYVRDLATHYARGLPDLVPPEREQGMPGACCTRGLVCNVHEEVRTRAYRYSRSTPAFPAQWVDGLCRALPGDEFVLPPSLPALWLNRSGWIESAPGSLAPATGVGTTRFCRTLQRRTSCALCSLTDDRPANPFTRLTLPRPPQPAPTFVTMANAPLLWDGMAGL